MPVGVSDKNSFVFFKTSAVATPGTKLYLSNSFPNAPYLVCEVPPIEILEKASDASKKGVPVSPPYKLFYLTLENSRLFKNPRDLPFLLFYLSFVVV